MIAAKVIKWCWLWLDVFLRGGGQNKFWGQWPPGPPIATCPLRLIQAHLRANGPLYDCVREVSLELQTERLLSHKTLILFLLLLTGFISCAVSHLTNKAAYLLSCKLYRYWVVYSYWRFESIRCDSVIASWQGRGRIGREVRGQRRRRREDDMRGREKGGKKIEREGRKRGGT